MCKHSVKCPGLCKCELGCQGLWEKGLGARFKMTLSFNINLHRQEREQRKLQAAECDGLGCMGWHVEEGT